jgi:hypothetical protein
MGLVADLLIVVLPHMILAMAAMVGMKTVSSFLFLQVYKS